MSELPEEYRDWFLEMTSCASVLAALLGPTVDTHSALRNAWFHSGYIFRQFTEAIWTKFHTFYVPVDV